MQDAPARRMQQLIYQAGLLLEQAERSSGNSAFQQACTAGAVALASQGLSALVAELASPNVVQPGHWIDMLQALPPVLQERRLLERELLTVEGALYPLHLCIEQQRKGKCRATMVDSLATDVLAAPRESEAETLRAMLNALVSLAQSLRASSQFC